MKKHLTLLFMFAILACGAQASWEDFYEHNLGLFATYSSMSSESKLVSDYAPDPNISYYGLGMDNIIVRQRWSLMIRTRQLQDLVHVLVNLMNDDSNNFNRANYISDFGILPNVRWGLNALYSERLVLNAGLEHSYFLTSTADSISETDEQWLSVGPSVFADVSVLSWLAIRARSGIFIPYYSNSTLEDSPIFWDHSIELMTSPGFVVGIDMLFTSLDDRYKTEYSRMDFKLGYRFCW